MPSSCVKSDIALSALEGRIVNPVIACPNCGSGYEVSAERCPACGEHLGYPNVRAAADPSETEALMQRYDEAVERATARGAGGVVNAFESAVSRSSAAVTVDLFRLREFIVDKRTLYTNYCLAVSAQTRQAAEDEFDRHRRAVDAILFGGYAHEIRFAALSIDGKGLESYGAFTMVLREVTVFKRSTVLEENSFDFVERHGLKPGSSIPMGYRAVWENRQKLAVAKLADFITSDTDGVEFASLLLYSDGDRKRDRFIEVQMFGSFNTDAIESVRGSSTWKRADETAVAAVVKEHVVNAGKSWIEA